MRNLLKLVISIIGCQLIGLLGVPFTISAIPSWYETLNKPFFSPPNWVFGPTWTILYFMMGIAFYLVWKQGWHKKQIKTAGHFFLIQLGLNFIWTPIFFGLKSPLLAIPVIITMWIYILITIRHFYPLSKWAAYLLIPYLLWVSFASILNIAIVILQ